MASSMSALCGGARLSTASDLNATPGITASVRAGRSSAAKLFHPTISNTLAALPPDPPPPSQQGSLRFPSGRKRRDLLAALPRSRPCMG